MRTFLRLKETWQDKPGDSIVLEDAESAKLVPDRAGPTAYGGIVEFLQDWTAADGRTYRAGDFERLAKFDVPTQNSLLTSNVVSEPTR